MQKKNEQTMNRIFDSAESLFSEKDFHDVKMEEIAKDASIFIDQYVKEKAIKDALTAYLEYVIQRNY